MSAPILLEPGQVFGPLTVQRQSPNSIRSGNLLWESLCNCGKTVHLTRHQLLSRLKRKRLSNRACGCHEKHGQAKTNSRTPFYSIWLSMIRRCTNVKASDYPRYGGRGIKVCHEWLTSFITFRNDILASIGGRPSDKHGIDRKENNRGYEPGNVRWATQKEQSRNRCTNHWITFNGETLCATDWALRLGITYGALKMRLRNRSEEEVLSSAFQASDSLFRTPSTVSSPSS